MIQQGFVTPWSIFTPTAFRMMSRAHVDRFFATGELQLASFKAFAQHPDEAMRDEKEGHNAIMFRGPASTVCASVVHGSDAYVLCATACRPTTELIDHFQKPAAIQIFDTTAFGAAIAKHVPGMRFGFEGYCFYTDGGIEYKIPDVDLAAFQANPDTKHLEMSKLFGWLQGVAGNAVYFRKASRFSPELEYRWVWITPNPQERLVITVPEARDFCLPWYSNDVEQRVPADGPRAARSVRG